MTVRVGIVGAGFAASLHAQGLLRAPDTEIVAVASRDAEHSFVFARTFGIKHAFVNYTDMLEGDLVDAITVACPNALHHGIVMAAAAAGKHVLVEKPLAMSLAQCDEMIAACRQAKVILMYGENLCFAPKYVRAKQLADEGALGDVYYVRQLECHGGPHADWFWEVRRSGGGVLMDMGCHSIAFCRWVMGNAPVASVSAELGRFLHGERTQGDDHSLVTMRFAAKGDRPGAIGVAENSWARPGGLDDRAEIYGTKGLTVADLSRGSALTTYSEPGYGYSTEKAGSSRGWTWSSYEDIWAEGFQHEMAHFVRCVREGETPMITGEDGRAVLEIVCAAYASARTGKRVSLPFQTDAAKPIDLWLAEGGR
jgi:myo-inositol 2-dehydrogenase/D-chiro-inositol 1-dehydrogenase